MSRWLPGGTSAPARSIRLLVVLAGLLAGGLISVAVAATVGTRGARRTSSSAVQSVSVTPVPSCPTGSSTDTWSTDTWEGGATAGAWETGSWSEGTPSSSNYVCIPSGATVDINSTDSVEGLLLESGATLDVQSGGLTLTGASSLPDSALQGSLVVASGAGVAVGASATLLNATGGAIANQGTVSVAGAFEQDAGTVATASGDNPVELNDGSSLAFAGTGAGAFRVTDPSASTIGVALSGNVAADQSLEIQSPPGNGDPVTMVTATGSFTNAGTITFDHNSADAESSSELVIPTGDTLTNLSGGTIDAIGSGDGSYPTEWNESIDGNVDNQGTLNVGLVGQPYADLVFAAGSTLTNDGGSINVLSQSASSNSGSGNTSTLIVSAATTGAGAEPAATLDNSAGTIANQGAITVSGSFIQGAGTVSTAAGDNPVQLLNGSAMNFVGSGPGAFQIGDASGTALAESLSGDIAAGQSLEIQASQVSFGTTNSDVVTAAGSFTNAGTITFDHAGAGGEDSVELALPSGDTVTNTGAIKVEGSPDGSLPGQWNENIDGNIDNYGVLDVGISGQPYADLVLAAGSTLTNDGGSLNILSNAASSDSGTGTSTLNISAATSGAGAEPAAAIDNSSGTIANHGAIIDAGSFTQGAGTVATGTGDDPVQLTNGSSLAFTGTGAGAFQVTDPSATTMNETLSGNIAADQSLEIQSTSDSFDNELDTMTATGSFTNAGTITLDHSSNGGEDSVELAVPAGDTLTNTGTIDVEGSGDGSHPNEWNEFLGGHVDNQGTLNVGVSGDPYAVLQLTSGSTLTNDGGTVNLLSKAASSNIGVSELVSDTAGITQTGGTTNLGSGSTIDVSSSSSGYALGGGTLAGIGQLTGNLDQTGGTLAPGTTGTPGTIMVSGTYTQGSGATLAIPINGTASSDYSVLAVSGNASLAGSLSLQPSSSYSSSAAAGDSDPVFTFGGSLTGNFSSANVAPQNTALPQVNGSTSVGDQLTCVPGSFTDSPATLTYQWNRNGAAISNATSSAYTITSADLGTTLSCTETASGGSALGGGYGFTAVVGSGVIDAVVGSTYASGSSSATSTGTAIPLPASGTPAVLIPATSIPDGNDHRAYGGVSIAACGGTAPSCEVYSPSAGTLVDSSGAAVSTPDQFTFAKTSGTLPSGMQLSTEGYLYGTPSQAGSFQFSVVATDPSEDSSTPATYTLTVAPAAAVTVTPATISSGQVHDAYGAALTACGGTAPTCQVYSPSAGTLVDTSGNPVAAGNQFSFATTAGNLPSGISLSSEGYLSGTPTQSGSFQFTVVATDATDDSSSPYSYTLTIAPAPVVTSSAANLANAIGANPYGAAISACGGTAATCESYSASAAALVDSSGSPVPSAQRFTFTVSSGSLPPGITLSSQGYLSGTPTQTGSYQFAVSATDASGDPSSPYTYTLTVQPGISISAGSVHIAGALPTGAADVTAGSSGGINAVSIDGGSSSSLATVTGAGVPSGADQVGLQIGQDQSGDCETELQIGNAEGVVFNAANLDISGCDSAVASSESASTRRGRVEGARNQPTTTIAPRVKAHARPTEKVITNPLIAQSAAQTAVTAASDCSTTFGGTTLTFTPTSAGAACTITTSASGAVGVSVNGGGVTGELDGSTQSTSFQMSSLIDDTASIPSVMPITPLTTFVDSYATGLTSSGTPLTTAHQTADQAVMAAYGFTSGTTAESVIPSFSPSVTGADSEALSVLGALESEADTAASADSGALATAMASDIADGVFNGAVTESLGSGTLPVTLPVTAGTSLFQTGVTAFASSYAASIPSLAPAASSITQALPVMPMPVAAPTVVAPTPVGSIQKIGPGAFTETVTAASPSVSDSPFPTSGGATFTIEVVS